MTLNARSGLSRTAAPLAVLGSAVLMACTVGATGASQPAATTSSPVCEIVTKSAGGMTIIEGVVTSPSALTGSYTLRVSGSGTNIRQGGEFAAVAGEKTVLGQVSLGGNARAYEIDLKVEVGGRTIPCNTRA
ncbi:MAG: curli-like amyloid fiber formation chaperone CsgH [Aliihoeflea sp.]|uniref:curli-like amyloid fiber formation chaperone CsgH n=1 Tax=Aliihoeflea sp. TaxID=2608088 RepID=UPI004033503F